MLTKRLTTITLCFFTLIGLITSGLSFFDPIACEGQPINNNVDPTAAQQIFGETVIGQTFVAPRDGLNRIDLFLQTYGRKNTHNVVFRLLEVTPNLDNPFLGTEVFNISFNAATVGDQTWRAFNFPALPHSAGKTYLITLQSPESVDGDAITVGGIERDSYLPGTAYLGPIPLEADIAFRSCYQMSTLEKLQVLAGQMTRQRPGMWGTASFYGVILLVYVVLLVGFFWKLARWAIRLD